MNRGSVRGLEQHGGLCFVTAMVTVYGIPNCDTVKKARKWLDTEGIAHEFHDFRKDGLDEATVQAWIDELGWEVLVNRRSTTWKQLDASAREAMDADSAAAAVLANPTLIKRPVLDTGEARYVGFAPDLWKAALTK